MKNSKNTKQINLIKPNIPNELQIVEKFSTYSIHFKEEEIEIEEIRVKENYCDKEDFFKLSMSCSVLENCKFMNCDFEKSSFVDVVFINCDFSNSNFQNAYFNKCEFISCKCLGIDLYNASLKQVLINDSIFQYANLNRTDFNSVKISDSDLSNANLSDCKQKNFEIANTQLINVSFFKTMLKAIDFTTSQIGGIAISDNLIELRGAIVNEYQASDLVKLLGVVVK